MIETDENGLNSFNSVMKSTRSKNNLCRITRRADKQGVRPPGRDQPGVEKLTTGISHLQDDPVVLQNRDNPEPGPLDPPSNHNYN